MLVNECMMYFYIKLQVHVKKYKKAKKKKERKRRELILSAAQVQITNVVNTVIYLNTYVRNVTTFDGLRFGVVSPQSEILEFQKVYYGTFLNSIMVNKKLDLRKKMIWFSNDIIFFQLISTQLAHCKTHTFTYQVDRKDVKKYLFPQFKRTLTSI